QPRVHDVIVRGSHRTGRSPSMLSLSVLFVVSLPLFLFLVRPPPSSTLFPYTTLFRSKSSNDFLTSSTNGTIFSRATCSLSIPDSDRKSTRLNSSHVKISYAVFCLKKKTKPGGTEWCTIDGTHQITQHCHPFNSAEIMS